MQRQEYSMQRPLNQIPTNQRLALPRVTLAVLHRLR